MNLSRRSLFTGAGGLAAASVLSSCSGLTGSGSSGSGGGGGGAAGSGELTFTTWASDAEKSAFTKLVSKFQDANKGTKVNLRVVPYEEMFTGIDTSLQAGTAPDIFRVDYPTLGLYSSTDQLLDLSDKIDTDLASDFIPALFQAVKYEDKPFGVPHQTDTTAVVYQPALLEAAGITSVPDTLDSAWTWEEWADVNTKLVGSLSGGVAPFVYDWQEFGAYRWLTWLFEAGGRLLEEDLKTSAIVSAEGTKALEFTKSFFDQGWVPKNTSTKGSYPDSVFISGKCAMAFVGDFLLPSLEDGIKDKFEWKATFQPRDVRASSDLGGNALVATQQSKNPDLAAEFLNFMVQPENMQAFCEESVELPTLTSLVDADLQFATRPDLMPTFVQQATTMTAEDVAQVTTATFGQVNTLLQDQLDLCFTGKQSVDETLQGIADGLEQAAAG